jgi:hypothetical protein
MVLTEGNSDIRGIQEAIFRMLSYSPQAVSSKCKVLPKPKNNITLTALLF